MASKSENKKLLETAMARWKSCQDSSDVENKRLGVEDLKFLHVPGESWDATLKSERGNRPCYSFPRLRTTIKRVVNSIRENRPQAKIRAVEDGDKDTATVLEGLCRNIWSVSDGDAAVDVAAEFSVGAGMGAWRIVTEYADDSAWDQDIRIESIRNPMALWVDPSARDPMKRDAGYWFLESRMTKESYKAKYGDKEPVEWEASEFDEEDWQSNDSDSVRICEYWYKKPVTKLLLLLSDGSTVDADATSPDALQGRTVTRKRSVQTNQICMAIIAGDKVLEGPTEWAGSKFPFVVVYGEHLVVDGRVYWFGLTRHAKDAQRAYDFSRTLAVEGVSMAPQAKYWATPVQAQGHTEMWARAHKENLPFQLFNPDPQQPGAPQRMGGADIPAALINEMQVSAEDIKAVTGIFDASLGQRSNESSGVAIRARQAQGEISTYNYADNVARAVRYTHELLVDLIPKIYDSERSIRILGADGAETYAKVNSPGPNGETVNDLSRGKYDTDVTVGPNMGTQRQEAAEVLMGLMQGNPGVFPILGDLMLKLFDYPYSDEMAERLRLMAPPQVQQMLAQKEQQGGKPMDPRAQAAIAQAEGMMQQVQMHGQLVQEASTELEQMKADASSEKAAAEKAKYDVQIAAANLKVQEANLQKQVAQFEKLVVETETRLAQETQDVRAQDKEEMTGQVEAALQQINAQSEAFMVAAGQLLQQIQTVTSQPIAIDRSSRKVVRMKRVNGKLSGELLDADTGAVVGNASVERVNGELIGQVNEA